MTGDEFFDDLGKWTDEDAKALHAEIQADAEADRKKMFLPTTNQGRIYELECRVQRLVAESVAIATEI